MNLFESKMINAPRYKFFASETEQASSMAKRLEFLCVLQKLSKSSGIFRLTDEFVHDFVERND